MLRDQEADFILQNNKVVYPPVSTDGLELYYDVKGKKNSDLHKDKLLDMSGNDRHGELQSFSYKNLSGYQEDSELVFDGIDDTLKMPKLSGINPSNFTYQLNNNILAFTGNEVKTVKNGDVEIGGRNLIPSSVLGWGNQTANYTTKEFEFSGWAVRLIGTEDILNILESGEEYTISYDMELTETTDVPTLFSLQTGLYLYSPGGHGSGAFFHTNKLINKGDKYRYVRTFVAPEIVDHRVLMYSNKYTTNGNSPKGMDTLRITNLKLEKGSTATDWTPAPEDLIETIDLKENILGDMEDTIDDHTRDEQSGLEVFTDKADDSLVRVEIDGKSYQHAGSGKNLLGRKLRVGYFQDASVTIINSDSRYRFFDKPVTLDAGTYTFSQKDNNIRVIRTSIDGAYSSAAVTSFTLNRRAEVNLAFRMNTDEPIEWDLGENTVDAGLQIEEGSTATEYEPPAPSPDYPIEIHSLNDFDVVSASKPRNVLVNGDFSTGAPGWALRYDERIWDEERQALIIGRTYMNESVIFQEKELKKGYKYFVRLQGTAIGATLGGFVYGAYKSLTDIPTPRKHVNLTNYSTGHSFIDSEIVTPINSEYKYFGIGNNATKNELRIKNILIIDLTSTFGTGNEPSLEECDSIFREWHPAPEDISESNNHPQIDKINLLLSEPLRSVGDVKDRLFKDSDGLWKIERNVGERIVDGSAGFALEQRLTNSYVQIYMSTGNWNKKVSSSTKGLSDRFPDIKGAVHNGNDPTMGIYTHNGYNVVRFKIKLLFIGMTDSNSNAEILTAFKNWLGNNNTKVIYELANPTIEILGEELQDKLNNLRSFQDSNYVYTIINDSTGLPSHIFENLKPTIHTKFLAKDHYKENRTVNNLLIWNRSLEDEELLDQNKLFHERFNMKSNTVRGEPINQEINLIQGGYVANTLSLEYTIEI